MKLSALAPVFLLSLGTLTACGGGSETSPDPTPDTTAPVITLNGDSALTHSAGSVYADAGATANDATDGSVDVTMTGAVDSNVVKNYTLTYTATDAAGNTSNKTRTVNVIDDVAPILEVIGDNPLVHNAGDTYTDEGASVSDNVDEASSITITTAGEVNADVVGSYTLTYTATDTAGNEATPVERTVNVVDVTAPVITLSGDAVIEHNYGDLYTDLGATADDAVDGSVDVTIDTDNLLINKIGSYGVTFTAVDAAGNEATLERIVNVVDNEGPVITLTGGNTITLGQGRIYKELGATALDVHDNEVIDIPTPFEGTVDNTTIGQYQLTYTATDLAGNKETLVRTVDVVAPRPFITTWKTTTDNEDLTINATSRTGYFYTINWGDGNIDTDLTAAKTHTYVDAGEYDVTISGGVRIFKQSTMPEKLIYIKQWGDIAFRNTEEMFAGCVNMTSVATDTPNLTDVYDMRRMFKDAKLFNSDIGDWDVSIVEGMSGVFYGASTFNQDISRWDVSSVTNLSEMFRDATAFNQDIGVWVPSSLVGLSRTFNGATAFNQDISSWNISSVFNMVYLFADSGLSTANYDALLNSWSTQTLTPNAHFGAGDIKYSPSSQAARDIFTSAPNNWNFTDGGPTTP